jgi:hypothetical protein
MQLRPSTTHLPAREPGPRMAEPEMETESGVWAAQVGHWAGAAETRLPGLRIPARRSPRSFSPLEVIRPGLDQGQGPGEKQEEENLGKVNPILVVWGEPESRWAGGAFLTQNPASADWRLASPGTRHAMGERVAVTSWVSRQNDPTRVQREKWNSGEMVTPQCQGAVPHTALWPDTLRPQPQARDFALAPRICTECSLSHCHPDSGPKD